MSDVINEILVFINGLLVPITLIIAQKLGSFMPAWAANIVITAPIGFGLMLVYKYTSNQKAIGRVKDGIKADMLALKLFKDSLAITFMTQLRLFKGAFLLLLNSLLPVLVMALPVTLLLAHYAMWYDSRAFLPGEEAVVVMELNMEDGAEFPDVGLSTHYGDVDINAGPVRVQTKEQIYWRIVIDEFIEGDLVFNIGKEYFTKEIAISPSVKRVSPKRPGWNTLDILTYPAEQPFEPDSVVRSIEIIYPKRTDWPLGIDSWLVYFIVLLFLWALVAKPFLKVKM